MGDRDVPFDENAICDICGVKGTYDFMGDLLCPKCAEKAMGESEPYNRCGHDVCICGEPLND
jgi:hypothetical protein